MWQDYLIDSVRKVDAGQVPYKPHFGTDAVRIYSAHVISGATAGIVNLYNGTSTSADKFAMLTCATVSTGNTFDLGPHGMLFPKGCYYAPTVDANVTSVVFTYSIDGEIHPSSSSSCSSSSSSCRSSSSSSSSRSSSSSSCRSSSSSSSCRSSSSSSSCRSSSSSSCRSSSSSSSCRSSSSSSCRSSSSSSSCSSSSSSCRSSSSSSANP